MERLQLTKYHEAVEIDNIIILFSSITCSIITVSKEQYYSLKDNDYTIFNQDELNNLIRLGFLLSSDDLFLNNTRRNLNPNRNMHLTILTTTSCNARCSYCFEKGASVYTLSKDICDAIIDKILSSQVEKVVVSWFGGEPLLNTFPIKYINDNLIKHNIKIRNTIVTNGYLIYKEIEIFEKYSFSNVQITLDGIQEKYNDIKNYVYKDSNPFKKVINNINLLVSHNIHVSIRLNYSNDNCDDVIELINYLKNNMKNLDKLFIYSAPIFEKGKGSSNTCSNDTIKKVFTALLENGFINKISDFTHKPKRFGCGIYYENNFVINANGDLYKCEHCIGNCDSHESFGNILLNNEYNKNIIDRWEDTSYPSNDCIECSILPICQGGCKYDNIKSERGCICHFVKPLLKDILLIYYRRRKGEEHGNN